MFQCVTCQNSGNFEFLFSVCVYKIIKLNLKSAKKSLFDPLSVNGFKNEIGSQYTFPGKKTYNKSIFIDCCAI